MASPGSQLELFASTSAFPSDDVRALAARLPDRLRLGTSSWSFPGWAGLCYPAGRPSEAGLAREGLRDYARWPLFRTVGIDRSYYQPLSADDLGRYAQQLPEGFRCCSKVWEGITTRIYPRHPRAGPLAGQRNPHFLDAALFEDVVLAPYAEAFRAHAGPFLLQLAPTPGSALPPAAGFAEELGRFLERLPRAWDYAVELRDRALLHPEVLAVLQAHDVAYVPSQWTRMPALERQLLVPGVLTSHRFVVARLSVPPGQRYDERRAAAAPFARIVRADPELRRAVRDLWRRADAQGLEAYVLVNNKVEGSAPLTIRALAEEIAGLER